MAETAVMPGGYDRLDDRDGNELDKAVVTCCGRFDNPWPGWHFPSVWWAILLFIKSFFVRRPRMLSPAELDQALPVSRPNFPPEHALADNEVRATWLGHSSVLFQLDGVRVLCDPIFSDYCSPLAFLGIGPRRFRPVPCSVRDLPEIDAVVISHTHYDHLDRASVLDLNERFPEMAWFVPKGCAGWMRARGCQRVHEMDWWEKQHLEGKPHIKLAFTPTQHWSGRGLCDRNKSLWGSWAIIGPQHRVWFAGDTGYCPAFVRIGRKYGPFDLAAIPIGAYSPQWFLHPQHVDPKQAVMVHRDVGARQSFGIHWGTFVMSLSEEPILEPPRLVAEAVTELGLDQDSFLTIGHGQTLVRNSDTGEHRLE